MRLMKSSLVGSDSAENSIMQTISIAVSAVLIAAGLITAPSLINNARDANSKQDLASIAQSQELWFSIHREYASDISELISVSIPESKGTKLTISSGTAVAIATEKNSLTPASVTAPRYIAVILSPSGHYFWRTGDSTAILSRTDPLMPITVSWVKQGLNLPGLTVSVPTVYTTF